MSEIRFTDDVLIKRMHVKDPYLFEIMDIFASARADQLEREFKENEGF